jgi:hypothetical protein
MTVLLSVVTLVVAIGSESAGAASPAAPHITARPNDLMVNTKTTLTGAGFPARTKLTIEECARRNWVVPQDPCVNRNKIIVTTDSHGRFVHQFKVTLCGGKRGPEPTSQVCYVGDPHPQGVDTVTLLGGAKVVITYP